MAPKQLGSKKKPSSGNASPSRKEPLLATTTPSRNVDTKITSDAPQLSVPHQQRILNHFAAAFDAVLTAAAFPQLLQEIKQALYRRDFACAFGRGDYLAAYAARWSPTRALCYAGIFQTHLAAASSSSSSSSSSQPGAPPPTRTRMVCVGGCAAEHVAFASYLRAAAPECPGRGELTLLDAAPWADVAVTMQDTLAAPLPLSKYASAAARAANAPLLETPEQLRLQVVQQDALELTAAQWADILAPVDDAAVVVTLMFTLNELYTSGGIARTTAFLKALEAALPHGALLLVVDSPGSYSEAALGKDKKKYPMQWLLHHTLTDPASAAQRWTRLESHDSIWFRLSDQLTYPIQLENMRYQLHLYRIDKTSAT